MILDLNPSKLTYLVVFQLLEDLDIHMFTLKNYDYIKSLKEKFRHLKYAYESHTISETCNSVYFSRKILKIKNYKNRV